MAAADRRERPAIEDCRDALRRSVDPPARDDRPRPREQKPAQETGDQTAEVCLLIDVGDEVAQDGHEDDDTESS